MRGGSEVPGGSVEGPLREELRRRHGLPLLFLRRRKGKGLGGVCATWDGGWLRRFGHALESWQDRAIASTLPPVKWTGPLQCQHGSACQISPVRPQLISLQWPLLVQDGHQRQLHDISEEACLCLTRRQAKLQSGQHTTAYGALIQMPSSRPEAAPPLPRRRRWRSLRRCPGSRRGTSARNATKWDGTGRNGTEREGSAWFSVFAQQTSK